MEANSTALVPGSLSAVAKREGQSLAETFLGVDVMILIDVSASMEQRDSRDGMSRYQVALAELGKIQRSMPGRLGIVAFSTHPVFCPGGAPPMLAGETDWPRLLISRKWLTWPACGSSLFRTASRSRTRLTRQAVRSKPPAASQAR